MYIINIFLGPVHKINTLLGIHGAAIYQLVTLYLRPVGIVWECLRKEFYKTIFRVHHLPFKYSFQKLTFRENIENNKYITFQTTSTLLYGKS